MKGALAVDFIRYAVDLAIFEAVTLVLLVSLHLLLLWHGSRKHAALPRPEK
ncbi:hypothetical protein OOZ51_04585 [Arthrobacter sp. MI7-26]|uniref:hypothetical protein n=1 Tax=Arthrobacter sp. MI7-26 TaxID=2993653 RepID=UPI0022498543|nr:hypothetical protein [Arthrobacter sp. MI7-26]MCX2747091.1 hypothetical protein [Arthrobacter sp. MI7-26]